MKNYMLLLWIDEPAAAAIATASPEDAGARMKEWGDYTDELRAAGVLVSGEGLEASSTSTTLRLNGGERVLSDGPFAETKEQVGGFYVIKAENLDKAIEWAEKVPSAKGGMPVEIRPVIDYGDN